MSLESVTTRKENNSIKILPEISQTIWRDCFTFIKRLPQDEQEVAMSLLRIEKSGNPQIDRKNYRKRYQTLQAYRRQWKSIYESAQLIEFGNSKEKESKYFDDNINLLNLQEEQKIYIWTRLKNIWLKNGNIVLDFLKNENDSYNGYILLDVLTYINESDGDILNWNIPLGNEWINAIKILYPEIDTNQITLNWLSENLLKDNEEIWRITRQAIEDSLNDKFLSILDEEIWSSLDSNTSNRTVTNIINNPNSLRFFINYYNYKNPWKALWIDPNINPNNLQPGEKEKLEKAIKEELYENGFIVDLSDNEKEALDIENNNRINSSKEDMKLYKNRWRWNYWRFIRNFKDNQESANYDEILWKNISYRLGIWKRLTENFSSNNEIDTDNPIESERIFNHARRRFCKESKIWPFPIEFAKNLYTETNNFSNFSGDGEFLKKFESKFWKDKSKFDEACTKLKITFSTYLNNAKEKTSEFHSIMTERKNAINNDNAIGSVIDGIRYVFSNLWNKNNIDGKIHNLELNQQNPIELENNGKWLIINWTFKNNPVKIKYDLITWEIYMNSCINRKFPTNEIIFWKNEPDFYIWDIPNFTTILQDYEFPHNEPQNGLRPNEEEISARIRYKREKFQESFENRLDEINETIWNSLETNQTKNEVTTNLLKTLGIIEDNPNHNRTNSEFTFEEWSDAYNVIQIINNSSKEELTALEGTIKDLTIYSWIIRGKKELNKNYEQYEKIKDNTEILNNETNEEQFKDLKKFWWNTQNFTHYEWPPWIIPKDYKNWLTAIIYENFTNWESSPERKLEKSKMIKYFKDIYSQYEQLEAEALLKF